MAKAGAQGVTILAKEEAMMVEMTLEIELIYCHPHLNPYHEPSRHLCVVQSRQCQYHNRPHIP